MQSKLLTWALLLTTGCYSERFESIAITGTSSGATDHGDGDGDGDGDGSGSGDGDATGDDGGDGDGHTDGDPSGDATGDDSDGGDGDSSSDTGSDPSGTESDATPGDCEGFQHSTEPGCWYLGDEGADCSTTCEDLGSRLVPLAHVGSPIAFEWFSYETNVAGSLPFECLQGNAFDVRTANGKTPGGLESDPACRLICSCSM